MGKLTVNLLREIWRTRMRFFSIVAIAFLGTAFFAGLRSTSPNMQLTGDAYFDRSNLADITVMSTAGITADDIRAIEAMPGVAAVVPELTQDALMRMEGREEEPELNIHLISMPLAIPEEKSALLSIMPAYDIDPEPDVAMNIPVIRAGRLPLDDHEIALDSLLEEETAAALGDWAVFETAGGRARLRVVGFVDSARYISEVERGISTVGTGISDGFAFASGNTIGRLATRLPLMASLSQRYTQATILVEGARALSGFSEEYDALVDGVMRRIEAYGEATEDTWFVWDRSSNPGFTDYRQNTERIGAVAELFPLMFFVVAALVALTTMTRMVEEERIQMGTLKALGYSNFAIVGEYLLYAAGATVIGGALGCAAGSRLFPVVIMTAYSIMYHMPSLQTPFHWDISLMAVLSLTGVIMGAAYLASASALKEVPASLMRPKAPKPGKRVFLERISFIWNRLSFTSKVTARNLIRYKKRFWMSVVGIAGSCALLVTGFGLKNSIYGIIDRQFHKLWHMDLQAYAYDPMPLADWEALLAKQDVEQNAYGLLYCYEKTYDVGVDTRETSSASLIVANDVERLGALILFYDEANRLFPLPDEGVVISSKLARIYSLSPGDTILLTSGENSYEATVAGVMENYVNHYVYCSAAYYERVFDKTIQYNAVKGRLHDTSLEAEERFSANMLADARMYTTSFTTGVFDTIVESIEILNYVVALLIASAAALAFVVMFNLTNINITERKRELATLQVLGFHDREMYDYVFRENNCLAVIGSFVGLGLGTILHGFVVVTCEVDIVAFVRKLSLSSFVYSLLLTVAFSLVVNLFMRRKVRDVDMVESLKSAE